MLNQKFKIIALRCFKDRIFTAYQSFFQGIDIHVEHVIITHMPICTRSYWNNTKKRFRAFCRSTITIFVLIHKATT